MLENTDVSCVCRTTSLGQPKGSLRWMVGYGANMTSSATTEVGDENSPELRYNRTLTMSDHGRTWLRCQLVWGAEELGGDTYMASVGRELTLLIMSKINYKSRSQLLPFFFSFVVSLVFKRYSNEFLKTLSSK